jgi:hypothetical protein
MTPLRLSLVAAFVLASTGAAAQDRRYDPKALARYDVSYAKCEASFADMKGHRDDAYLNLWRIAPGEKTSARLAGIRSSAPYKAERQRALRPAAAASEPEATQKLERECRGLWGEMRRGKKPAR